MTETNTWRPVPGYEGYLASPNQQVKRLAHTANGHNRKERLLVPSLYHKRPASRAKSNGPYVRITHKDKTRYVALAEIMAATFVCDGFDPDTHKILFNNHEPDDCSPSNLTIIERQ